MIEQEFEKFGRVSELGTNLEFFQAILTVNEKQKEWGAVKKKSPKGPESVSLISTLNLSNKKFN